MEKAAWKDTEVAEEEGAADSEHQQQRELEVEVRKTKSVQRQAALLVWA